MKLKGLKSEVSEELKNVILTEWSWLLGTDKKVMAITEFGDAFLSDEAGGIYWLDTGSGALEKVADHDIDFDVFLADPENQENWLLYSLLAELEESGLHCKEDEVYSYKKLPIIGGQYQVNNFFCVNAVEHFSLTSSLHFQIKDLADGTPIRFNITQ